MTAKKAVPEGPLSVACPVCGARAGKPCRDFTTAPLRAEYADRHRRGKAAFRNNAGSVREPNLARAAKTP